MGTIKRTVERYSAAAKVLRENAVEKAWNVAGLASHCDHGRLLLFGLHSLESFGYTVGGQASKSFNGKGNSMNCMTFPLLTLGLSLAPVLDDVSFGILKIPAQ